MSNDINTQNPLLNTRVNTSRKGPVGDNNVSNTESQKQADETKKSVTVSAQLSRLSELAHNISKLPEVDSNKVSEIKQAIADGSFTIDAKKVAEKLIDFETSYTGKRS